MASVEEMELLIQLALQDGSSLEFYRHGKDVSLCRKDHCVVIPRATGENTASLYALLEDLGVPIIPEDDDVGYGSGEEVPIE